MQTFKTYTHISGNNFCGHSLANELIIHGISVSTSPPEAIGTLYEPYLHFCYELALETSAKCSSIKSGFMTSATLTHERAYNGQGPPTSECFSRLKTTYNARNGAPKETDEPYLSLFASRREMAKPVPTNAFLQAAKAAAMCMASRAETNPPPPVPPFC